MSTHLGETINAVQNVFQTDNDDILDFRYPIRVQIESEQMDVSGAGFVGSEAIRWSVTRGVAGTTKAAHAVGTAITAVNASSGAGVGGVSVDNTVDAPFTATGFSAPGAIQDGDIANLPGAFWCGHGVAQAVDGDDAWHDLTVDAQAGGFLGTVDWPGGGPATQWTVLVEGLYTVRARVLIVQAPGSATYRAIELRRNGGAIGGMVGSFTGGMPLSPNQEMFVEVFIGLFVNDIVTLRGAHDAGAPHTFSIPSFIIQRIA